MEQLVYGLAIGLIYGLVAIGFSMTFSAMGLLHFALGEMVMLGALIGWTATVVVGLPYPLAFIVAIVAVVGIGFALERLTLYPLRRRMAPAVNMVIMTVGLSIALQNLGMLTWGANPVAFPTELRDRTVGVVGANISVQYLYVLVLSLALLGALHLFFSRTYIGIALRATAQDPRTARLMGINVDRTMALAFALSSGLAAASGILIGPIFYGSFDMGFVLVLKGFGAAVLGTFGNLPGALIGGLLLGVTEVFSANIISSAYKDGLFFGLMIVLLLVLPNGLLSRGSR